MRLPINVAVDTDGTRYVTDTTRGQVLIYSASDEYLGAIGKKEEFKPVGVAVAGNRLYVTDLKGHNVRVYCKVPIRVERPTWVPALRRAVEQVVVERVQAAAGDICILG